MSDTLFVPVAIFGATGRASFFVNRVLFMSRIEGGERLIEVPPPFVVFCVDGAVAFYTKLVEREPAGGYFELTLEDFAGPWRGSTLHDMWSIMDKTRTCAEARAFFHVRKKDRDGKAQPGEPVPVQDGAEGAHGGGQALGSREDDGRAPH